MTKKPKATSYKIKGIAFFILTFILSTSLVLDMLFIPSMYSLVLALGIGIVLLILIENPEGAQIADIICGSSLGLAVGFISLYYILI